MLRRKTKVEPAEPGMVPVELDTQYGVCPDWAGRDAIWLQIIQTSTPTDGSPATEQKLWGPMDQETWHQVVAWLVAEGFKKGWKAPIAEPVPAGNRGYL